MHYMVDKELEQCILQRLEASQAAEDQLTAMDRRSKAQVSKTQGYIATMKQVGQLHVWPKPKDQIQRCPSILFVDLDVHALKNICTFFGKIKNEYLYLSPLIWQLICGMNKYLQHHPWCLSMHYLLRPYVATGQVPVPRGGGSKDQGERVWPCRQTGGKDWRGTCMHLHGSSHVVHTFRAHWCVGRSCWSGYKHTDLMSAL